MGIIYDGRYACQGKKAADELAISILKNVKSQQHLVSWPLPFLSTTGELAIAINNQ